MDLRALKRPPGVTCEKFLADRAQPKRCQHYLPGGPCALGEEFMCVEWLKKNHPERIEDDTAPVRTQKALPGVEPSPPKPRKAPPVKTPPRPSSAQDDDTVRGVHPSLLDQEASLTRAAPLGTERVDQLVDRGMEMCIDGWGDDEIWVVPKYTGSLDRVELSIRDMATLRELLVCLPGARVKKIIGGKPRKED